MKAFEVVGTFFIPVGSIVQVAVPVTGTSSILSQIFQAVLPLFKAVQVALRESISISLLFVSPQVH